VKDGKKKRKKKKKEKKKKEPGRQARGRPFLYFPSSVLLTL
jgi:hypothetical protein